MRVLLDSHVLIWSADDPAKIPAVAMAVMQDPANELFLSFASIWEIAIKVGKGKLPLSLPFRQWMDKAIADLKLHPIRDHGRASRSVDQPAIPSP